MTLPEKINFTNQQKDLSRAEMKQELEGIMVKKKKCLIWTWIGIYRQNEKEALEWKKNTGRIFFWSHLLLQIHSEICLVNQMLASQKEKLKVHSSMAEKDNHHLENDISNDHIQFKHPLERSLNMNCKT